MRRTYSFQAILTFLAMSLAVGLPVVGGASESTDDASGDVDFVELAPDDDEAMGLMEVACSGEVEDRCDEEAYEVRHEKSVAVFSLKASGPERNEALESSLEYSSLADSGSSSGNSTEEDAVSKADVLEAICDEGSPTDGGCDSCPGYTSGFAPHGDEPFSHDTSKSFLFDETYSANLAATFEGCEHNQDLTQGTVFLGRQDGEWERLGYGSGLDVDKCLTFEHDDGKSVLVCSHYEGANGTEIYRLIQVSEDGGSIQFEEVDQFVHDSPIGVCQRDRFTNARLRDIEKRGSELHVEVKKVDVEIPSEFDHSCDPGFEQPELSRSTKTYRFDGEGFEAVDGDGEGSDDG